MSFEEWCAGLEGLEIPPGPAALAAAVGLLDRYAALVTAAVGVFDASREWDAEGATSVTAWLTNTGMCSGDGARMAQLARRFAALPVLAGAALSGELSGGQVRVIAAQLVDRHVGLFAAHEAELVPALIGLSVPDTVRAMGLWRARADAMGDGPEPADPSREVHLSATLDGRWVLNGALDAEGGAVVAAALRLANSNDLTTAAGQRNGDALVAVARWFLDNQQTKTGGRHRPHLNIIVHADTLPGGALTGEVAETGMRLDAPTVSRLLCDCAAHRVVVGGDGTILDYGRSTRTPPVNLFNALVVRDRHCRFPGCDRPPTWCDAHHVWWWEHHGPTALDNLVNS